MERERERERKREREGERESEGGTKRERKQTRSVVKTVCVNSSAQLFSLLKFTAYGGPGGLLTRRRRTLLQLL